MKKYLFSILVLLLMQVNLVLAEMSENAAMSFQRLENGFRISLDNIYVSEISDCSWDGVSVCAQLIERIQNNEIKISQNGSKINIDIPLSEVDNGIFDNIPIFNIAFSSGEILSSYIVFDAENKNSSYRFAWLRWVWVGGRWILTRLGILGATKQAIISTAKFIKQTKGGTKIYEKYGGFSRAKKDFYSMKPSISKDSTKIKVGKKDGENVIVHSFSKDGRPTLEFQRANGKKYVEIRYN
jgi:hypothetical protein